VAEKSDREKSADELREAVNKAIEDFKSWKDIESSRGVKTFMAELQRQLDVYARYMDNEDADGNLLKNYQLIRKGLKLALNIPKILENRIKNVKEEK